ncbi:hypothetical protein KFE25_000086 [Diacronema lutheri]|uniref:DNA-directed RNA polymerase subunit n=1 Tax=Diacronema lutheri TaxID=2081491 RepID=A0A8J5XGZ2_DIALT|nr:hypothetical protein KFE25_000086 [Diacronema lutheri]
MFDDDDAEVEVIERASTRVEASGGMHFCPRDGSLLMIDAHHGSFRFFCHLCPYVYQIRKPVVSEVKLERKAVDDVMGGEEAWSNVDQTEVICPKCQNTTAYFFQLQIRSADEPMTTFYKCTSSSCGNRWKDNG